MLLASWIRMTAVSSARRLCVGICSLAVGLTLPECKNSSADDWYHEYFSYATGAVANEAGSTTTRWDVGRRGDEVPCAFEHWYSIDNFGITTGRLSIICGMTDPYFHVMLPGEDASVILPLDEPFEGELEFMVGEDVLPGAGKLTILESVGDVVDDESSTTPGYLRKYRFTGEVNCEEAGATTCTGTWSFDVEGEQTAEDVQFYWGDREAY